MTLTQVWGSLLIFVLCPLLGGLPLIAWITKTLTRKQLSQVGTGNISVSAAFYHGGTLVGILAVLSEALKGIAAVLIGRYFFPHDPTWELMALIALVMGRYWMGRGAGTTNVVWGYVVYDPVVAGLTFLIGGISFTILRERQQGRLGILILFPLLTALRHPQEPSQILAAIALATLIGWIYHKIPDDLDLQPEAGRMSTQKLFRFFRGDRALVTLDQPLHPAKVGQKAATLSQLKCWGYPVPMGWVLPPGDDPEPLLNTLQPSRHHPLVVRSSVVGEDSETASAAGQYLSVLQVADRPSLASAIAACFASYDLPTAVQYRQDLGISDSAMAVLIQQQVQAEVSGVAFSRDPITRQGDAVVIEALPGEAHRVVSGQFTPESYQVIVRDTDVPLEGNWQLPEGIDLPIAGAGTIPTSILQQVAYLVRHLEARFHGVPQDMEWSYDGQTLWLLQSRPITTLLPIWTRKIAAEVIPGAIRPLTWSINRPLTCGVWGKLFTLVLGRRAQGLDFNETATLHSSHAYFNASLLGQIFQRMGLPTESLEFLTRGAKFTKPPVLSTLRNVPGLWRLAHRELSLVKDFQREDRHLFQPTLIELNQQPATDLRDAEILNRCDRILQVLERATYYSILAPLSVAFRKAMRRVPDDALDYSQTPEVAALRSLQALANNVHQQLPNLDQRCSETPDVLAMLADHAQGKAILQQFDDLLHQYGYLSEVGTDIAVSTWREDPVIVQALFTQFCLNPVSSTPSPSRSRRHAQLQRRVDLKGRVTEVYSRLLAELRWSFVALEQQWLRSGLLTQPGDLFFLALSEIRQIVHKTLPILSTQVQALIVQRRHQWQQDQQLATVPQLVYGDDPPRFSAEQLMRSQPLTPARQTLQGIGASPGQVEGAVKILRTLRSVSEIERSVILVVPYTDSGWAPLLAHARGLIAEVGGRLSHGAIVAREYGIPAVMEIPDATQRLQDGQWVRIDGQTGIVEIL
jgi:pyruvate,water dikinase